MGKGIISAWIITHSNIRASTVQMKLSCALPFPASSSGGAKSKLQRHAHTRSQKNQTSVGLDIFVFIEGDAGKSRSCEKSAKMHFNL